MASLEAETILEAGEFLETMQDYLDSSVISIIEDFSSLTEVCVLRDDWLLHYFVHELGWTAVKP